ncbi:hypothetical protein KR51_00021850 [Rubidibacter lacunae KORDI 51-2]|uniref:Glycosyltransferase RgtA/B/C/D-like domain-containing protein n=1 Tax=Rubidibacter lacunae KORDI 51-2 TaxID=582515 RepID=U5DHT5_9CHRO|nr:hypothetical protein [Rubidibacter lacunae]ERN41211.1 hypothetical protein KR51_00021850 [Rubidibacter lacunae KORDI 51-2]
MMLGPFSKIWHARLSPLNGSSSCRQQLFWLSLSLLFALAVSLQALQEAFSSEYVVQDDARQHVFWMLRYVDPSLFPNDPIADYFQSVAPAGYRAVYRLAAIAHISPFTFNKILPVLLGLLGAFLSFLVGLEILPVPLAGFCASILLTQSLGLTDAVFSGTPKAFIYILFLGFIYSVLRKSLVLCSSAIALQALFYPQLVLISIVTLILRLFKWERGRMYIIRDFKERWLIYTGLGTAFLAMLPFVLTTSKYGPTMTAAQARQFPEFFPGGRVRFFYDDDPAKFWLKGRSGIHIAGALTPVTNALGFLVPIFSRLPNWFPLVRHINPRVILLPQILAASLLMFFAAHVLLFRLHLPSRYTGHSLRVVLCLSAGVAIAILVDSVLRGSRHLSPPWRSISTIISVGLIATPLVCYPFWVDTFPIAAYKVGTAPHLYEFLQQQPKDIRVASLVAEANNLPSFAQRSIAVGSEYAIPYHLGYYQPFRKTAADLIRAQYSSDWQTISDFLDTYDISFWLLEDRSFSRDYLSNNSWILQHQPAADEALARLERGETPVLLTALEQCAVFQDQTRTKTLLDGDCLRIVAESRRSPSEI